MAAQPALLGHGAGVLAEGVAANGGGGERSAWVATNGSGGLGGAWVAAQPASPSAEMRRGPAQKCDAAQHSASVPSAGSRARYTGFA